MSTETNSFGLTCVKLCMGLASLLTAAFMVSCMQFGYAHASSSSYRVYMDFDEECYPDFDFYEELDSNQFDSSEKSEMSVGKSAVKWAESTSTLVLTNVRCHYLYIEKVQRDGQILTIILNGNNEFDEGIGVTNTSATSIAFKGPGEIRLGKNHLGDSATFLEENVGDTLMVESGRMICESGIDNKLGNVILRGGYLKTNSIVAEKVDLLGGELVVPKLENIYAEMRKSGGCLTRTNEFDVIYKLNGGRWPACQSGTNVVEIISLNKSIKVKRLGKPLRFGYKFFGWYSNKALTKRATEIKGVADLGHRTVYAKWKRMKDTFPSCRAKERYLCSTKEK